MLMYHPVLDTNHCIYRMLLIFEQIESQEIDVDMYRIIDYYLLFPSALKKLKHLPRNLTKYNKVINKIPLPYEAMQNEKRVMHELEKIQKVAMRYLVAKKYLDMGLYRNSHLKRTKIEIPEKLAKLLLSDNIVDEVWFKLVITELPRITLGGSSGLKKRSGLLEYKYDLEEK